jgi:hypothetical protein
LTGSIVSSKKHVQGKLIREKSVEKKTTKLLVFSNPVVGKDDEYNDWYDNQHLADVVAVDGIRSAQRYEALENPLTEPGPHRYLAIYEVDGDLARIAAEMSARREDGRMPVSDSIDTATPATSVWVSRGPEVVGPS